MSRSVRVLHALVVLVAAIALESEPAFAQFGPGGGLGGGMGPGGMGMSPGMGPQPGGGGKKKPKKKSNEPETHAASGASDDVVPAGAEPTLPAKPLEMSDSVKERIGTDAAIDEHEQGRGPESQTVRHPYFPWYDESNGKYGFRTLFPLWVERTQPSLGHPETTDRASLFGGVYYNRRSATHSDDILFPVFWNLRDPTSRTTVLGPFVNRRTKDESDDWLAPLYFTGKRPYGGYTIIPPLLTYLNDGKEGGFNLIGPAFCSWKGGDTCDTRTATDIDLGIVPFYFHGANEGGSYDVVPPLLHYHRENERELAWTDVWGPYYRRHTEKRDYLHLAPLYFSIWGENERHTTLFPFFHYGWSGNSSLFINPLYLISKGEKGESTFVTWGYARHRGRTELDMITPLYWHYRDPDIGLDQQLLFPFLYSRTSPRESNTAFFPFWGHFERYGVSETTFITPFFQHTHDLRGFSTNIHPLFYFGRDGFDTHTVIAPFFFDFATRESRATVGFPIFWRFAEDNTVSQLVGNTYYHERKVAHGLDWQIHIFPLFSYGETPNGHWWNLLYGLAGYTRRGDFTQVRTLWIPITVSGKDGH